MRILVLSLSQLTSWSSSKTITNTLFMATLSLIISSCATTEDPKEAATAAYITSEDDEVFAALLEPLEKSASDYLLSARVATPKKQPELMLLAARQHIAEGQYQPANAVLFTLREKPMNSIQQAGMRLLSAKILQHNKQHQDALDILVFQSQWKLPKAYLLQYHELRAQLNQDLKNPIAAVKELILLDELLENEERLKSNHELIWSLLKPYPADTLRKLVNAQAPDVERGWFELAAMSNEAMNSPEELTEALRVWRTFYPQHPARLIMPESLEAALIAKPYKPARIAVLLPLSGKRQKHGEAIRDGIISAFMDNKNQKWQAKLNFYDTQAKSMQDIYAEVINMENKLIVGPLLRDKLSELLALNPSLPLLALNRTPEINTNKDRFFFALSPDDEAENAAQRIYDDGYRYPMIIAPNSSFGSRVSDAFAKYWQQFNAGNAEIYQYDDRTKLEKAIQEMLGIKESKARIRQISSIAGKLESEPRSRTDIDSIYIISKPVETRLIKPYIEVNLSPGTKRPAIYVSSRSNGKKRSHEHKDELAGVFMSEIPWMLTPVPKQKEHALKLWPNMPPAQQKLYALGYDSFKLIPHLVQLRAFSAYKQEGLTGSITVNSEGQIKRNLTWTLFGHKASPEAERPDDKQTDSEQVDAELNDIEQAETVEFAP